MPATIDSESKSIPKLDISLITGIIGLLVILGTLIASYYWGGIPAENLWPVSIFCIVSLSIGYIVFLVLYHRYKYTHALLEIETASANILGKTESTSRKVIGEIKSAASDAVDMIEHIRDLQQEVDAKLYLVSDSHMLNEYEDKATHIKVVAPGLDYEFLPDYFSQTLKNLKRGVKYDYILSSSVKAKSVDLRNAIFEALCKDMSKEHAKELGEKLDYEHIDYPRDSFPFISGFVIYVKNNKPYGFLYIPQQEGRLNFKMDEGFSDIANEIFRNLWEDLKTKLKQTI